MERISSPGSSSMIHCHSNWQVLKVTLTAQQTIKPDTVFVLPLEEYQKALESGKFTDIQVKEILPYPNNQPGFYFLTMRYVDNVSSIFAAEEALRHVNQTETVTLKNGEVLTVSHSAFDMGTISDLFDGNKQTVVRTSEANPMHLEIAFGQMHDLRQLPSAPGEWHRKLRLRSILRMLLYLLYFPPKRGRHPTRGISKSTLAVQSKPCGSTLTF